MLDKYILQNKYNQNHNIVIEWIRMKSDPIRYIKMKTNKILWNKETNYYTFQMNDANDD